MSTAAGSVASLPVHPYVRVYCSLAALVFVALVPDPLRLGILGVIVAVIAYWVRIPRWKWLACIVPALSFVGVMIVVSLISGGRLRDLDSIAAVTFVMRCCIAFLLFSALFAATPHTEVIESLELLRIPVLFTAMASSIFRWFEEFVREVRSMNTARLLRGGGSKGRLAALRDILSISHSLILRSFHRAERVAQAMECRGFQGRLIRSLRKPIRLFDFLPLILTSGLLAALWMVTP